MNNSDVQRIGCQIPGCWCSEILHNKGCVSATERSDEEQIIDSLINDFLEQFRGEWDRLKEERDNTLEKLNSRCVCIFEVGLEKPSSVCHNHKVIEDERDKLKERVTILENAIIATEKAETISRAWRNDEDMWAYGIDPRDPHQAMEKLSANASK